MKIFYKNHYDDYTNFINIIKSKIKYVGYLFSLILFFLLIRYYWRYFNNQLTTIQLTLLTFANIIPLILFFYAHEIYKIIMIKKLNKSIIKYELLLPKQLEVNEKKIILTFANGKISEFRIDDIKGIQQINESLYVIRKDTTSLEFMPIIPINTFKNEEDKKKFIELISKNK